MNGAHIHLAVNHLPIVGVIIGALVLMAGMILRKQQVSLTALGIFIFSAITAMIANFTGEEAEEVVEEIAGVTHKMIHVHEEYAETFLVITIILGVISIATIYLAKKKHKLVKIGCIAALILSLAAIFTGKLTGTSGGEIMHTEIRE
ncbi:MAG TPA: hypothetical protein EYG86_03365 [Crocinitomicaceae bacterium]|nr:hypothetical protein [Crocinitomicaceae bacterium]